MSKTITIDRDYFEHLLNIMWTLLHAGVHLMNEDARQKILDDATEARDKGRGILYQSAKEQKSVSIPDALEWQVDPDKASSEYHLQLRDKQGWHSATAKYDGCVDLWKYHNVPLDSRTNKSEDDHRELADYIHYCNIDEEIARLQALKKVAMEYFNTKGYAGYWDEQ
jgi:hypothetical protein